MIEVLFIPLAGRHNHTYHAILCSAMVPNAAAIAANGFVRIMVIPNVHRYPVLEEMPCHMKLMMCDNVNNKTLAYCYIPMVRKCKWHMILPTYWIDNSWNVQKTMVGHGSLFYTVGPRISSVTGRLQVQTANKVEVWCFRFVTRECFWTNYRVASEMRRLTTRMSLFNDFTVVFFLQL